MDSHQVLENIHHQQKFTLLRTQNSQHYGNQDGSSFHFCFGFFFRSENTFETPQHFATLHNCVDQAA